MGASPRWTRRPSMNEDFYIEAQYERDEYFYFEPPYNPDEDWYDDEQDGEWVDE